MRRRNADRLEWYPVCLLGGRLELGTRAAPAGGRPRHASTGASMSVSFRAIRARLTWVSLAILIVAGIAGCTLKSGGYSTTSPPKIRFFNAAIEIAAVDVTVGTVLEAAPLGFGGNTTYRTAQTGSQ